MKAKPETIGARLDRPPPDIRLFLFHGPDEAGATILAQRFAAGVGADAERIDLDGATLRARPGLLADEAASLSLFGGRRHIRITAMGEESLEAVTLLLSAGQAGNPAVAIAPGVKASGKLVKLVTAADNAVAVGCYVPSSQEAARMGVAMARDAGVRLAADAAERLVAATAGDRVVMLREIEKLALFLDAADDRPRDADLATLDAIGIPLGDAEAAETIAAMIEGDAVAASADPDAVDAIPTLRAAMRRLLSLAEMRAEMDAGSPPETVVERHRVFFREQPAMVRALRRWEPARIARALERLRAAERLAMSGGGLGELATAAELLAIARAAGRRRN